MKSLGTLTILRFLGSELPTIFPLSVPYSLGGDVDSSGARLSID